MTDADRRTGARPLGVAGWCLYDWANSSVNTVIGTFVFAVYFAAGVVGDETRGSALWSTMVGVSGLAVAVCSPILGAVADHLGRRKPWLFVLMVMTVVPTALLWFVTPDPASIWLALVLAFFATSALELGTVFYNAMLPGVAPPHKTGRVSGWAWGAGYAGGLACLAVALLGLVGLGETTPWLPLPTDNSENIRATALLVALWFSLFCLPLFVFTPDQPPTGLSTRTAIRRGLRSLAQTLRGLPKHRDVLWFLVASALYRDAIITITAVGGLYAAGTFGMGFDEIIVFAIGLNVTAGLGAAAFAWVDDWLGPKRTILISLVGLMVTGAPIILVTDSTAFIVLALGLGIFFGPAQAASRSMMVRLSPPELQTEFFGLYALAGKSVAFVGPLLFGFATTVSGSQRVGLATILVFVVAGALILLRVREPSAADRPAAWGTADPAPGQ